MFLTGWILFFFHFMIILVIFENCVNMIIFLNISFPKVLHVSKQHSDLPVAISEISSDYDRTGGATGWG